MNILKVYIVKSTKGKGANVPTAILTQLPCTLYMLHDALLQEQYIR